jgi:uncharacterized protein (TIGR02466 family)
MNLDFTGYFITPIYTTTLIDWVKPLNKVCDGIIKDVKNKNENSYKERKNLFKKDVLDFGMSHHSGSLINHPEFLHLKNFVNKSSAEILNHMGYDITNHSIFWTEMWVQEFAKKGGGHHEGHIHNNTHISGFYFLKCSEKTSYPIFHDPRYVKTMSELPLKNPLEISFANNMINYKPIPGTLILFPSFLEHQFIVDYGIDPFRFIHFNLQCISNFVLTEGK